MDLCRMLFEMEAAPNQRNVVASLTDDLLIDIFSTTSRPAPYSPTNVCIAPRSASSLIIIKCYPRLLLASSTTVRTAIEISPASLVYAPSLEFLPFNTNNVAILDCCNGLILC